MIDEKDSSDSTLRAILWRALKSYSTNELLELVRDVDCIVRTAAAKQLHLRSETEVFDGALSLCSSPTEFEREIGAFILGQLGTPKLPFREKSLPVVIELLNDQSNEVKAAALAAIGHLGIGLTLDSALLEKVELFANDVCDDVRISCAFALGSFSKNSGALDVLKKMLLDSNPDVAEWAEVSIEILEESDKEP